MWVSITSYVLLLSSYSRGTGITAQQYREYSHVLAEGLPLVWPLTPLALTGTNTSTCYAYTVTMQGGYGLHGGVGEDDRMTNTQYMGMESMAVYITTHTWCAMYSTCYVYSLCIQGMVPWATPSLCIYHTMPKH